jgi:catechol 2,3-dioxygenase-like lactoylglutathione lyase family enzyme
MGARAGPRRELALVALLVRDYDEAIAWFRAALRFELLEDSPREDGKRWVRVGPRDSEFSLLLARAATPAQERAVGAQSGGRVFLFLRTSDFHSDYEHMKKAGVRFAEAPRREPYGMVVVFEDLYGNRWDLLGPPEAA